MSKEEINPYLHPKWQKKKAEILFRDDHTCQQCGSNLESGRTLVAHHIKYIGQFKWSTPDEWLVTLCQPCHDAEHHELKALDMLYFLESRRMTRGQIFRIILVLSFVLDKHTRMDRSIRDVLDKKIFRKLVPTRQRKAFMEFRKQVEAAIMEVSDNGKGVPHE